MEFVAETEVLGLLRDHGITEESVDDVRVYLRMAQTAEVVRLHLAAPETEVPPEDGAKVINVDPEELPRTIEDIIQVLRLSQVLLIPVSKWRQVFDAVAFSLATNEEWQEFETAATVELNTRDPLLCEPGDFHTISDLLRALLKDAEEPEQGLMVATTAAPVLIDVHPGGAIRVSFGNQVLADEVADALQR